MMAKMCLMGVVILSIAGLVATTVINISGDCSAVKTKSRELNWKQCTWTTHGNDHGVGTDNGLIHSCSFKKKSTDTHLRVVYQGNIRMIGNGKCSRWYFTFNGNECRGPVPIDAVYSTGGISINSHRAVTIEGLCSGVNAGVVNVEFKVGACAWRYRLGDAYTSWNANSRVIIEEVNPPQA